MSIKKGELHLSTLHAWIKQVFNKRDVNMTLVKYHLEETAEKIKAIFTKKAVAKHQQEVFSFYTPKTWKDSFKWKHRKKWWMRWWVKRHPIESKEIKINVIKATVFPKFRIPEGEMFKDHFVYFDAFKEELREIKDE